MHPTVKPVALVAEAIKDCSRRGEIVLDPFAGSGGRLSEIDACRRCAASQGGHRVERNPMVLERRGSPRKSRRVRLPSSSYTGKTRFMPSAGEMAAIEKPFGVHFNPEDCQQLISIVDAYFSMQPFERAAPFADDAQAYFNDVQTKANALWRSLEPSAAQREAAFFVQRLITENFHEGQGN